MPARSPEHGDHGDAPHAITEALLAMRDGHGSASADADSRADALERLITLVYPHLKRIARRQLRGEREGHTLSTTGLVHEAYLRLVEHARADVGDRQQFFAIAARAMRRVLVDYARRHRALRRGGGVHAVTLDDGNDASAAEVAATQRSDELIALDEALERLAAVDPRLGRVVECRFFAGLTEKETAEALDVDPRTVARDWVKARGWLYQELAANPPVDAHR